MIVSGLKLCGGKLMLYAILAAQNHPVLDVQGHLLEKTETIVLIISDNQTQIWHKTPGF